MSALTNFNHIFIFPSENNYFEIELLTRLDASIGPAIGLTAPFTSKFQYPGWKADTIGYHSDDGRFYNESGQGLSSFVYLKN